MNEGLAEYVEGVRTRTISRRLSPSVDAGQSLQSCILAGACPPDLFYPAAASMVDYLIQLRGMGGVRDVLNALARGDDVDTCLRRTYGRDQRSLVQDWEDFLRRRV